MDGDNGKQSIDLCGYMPRIVQRFGARLSRHYSIGLIAQWVDRVGAKKDGKLLSRNVKNSTYIE